MDKQIGKKKNPRILFLYMITSAKLTNSYNGRMDGEISWVGRDGKNELLNTQIASEKTFPLKKILSKALHHQTYTEKVSILN